MEEIKIINVNNLRKIRVVNNNKILESKINEWMDNGVILLSNIIDSICGLGDSIVFMDPNVSDMSFWCLDKNGDKLFVKLDSKDCCSYKNNSIKIINNDFALEYFFVRDEENIYLVLKDQGIIKKNDSNLKVLNKKK